MAGEKDEKAEEKEMEKTEEKSAEEKSWDEKKEVYRISDQIVRTTNITQSAIVKKGYSTVLAAAVFLF